MNEIDKYIARVIKGVRSEYDRNRISAELRSHLDDRIDYYMDCGLSRNEAENKAIEKMGNPEPISIKMDKLYSAKYNFITILFVLGLYFFIGIFAIGFYFLYICPTSVFGCLIEMYMLFLTAVVILSSGKRHIWWLNILPLIHNAAITVVVSITGLSPAMYFIDCLFSGKISGFIDLNKLIITTSADSTLKIQSILFYLIIIAVIILNIIIIKKENGFLSFSKVLKIAPSVIAVALVLIAGGLLISSAFSLPFPESDMKNIYIIESNECCDIDEINDGDITELTLWSYDMNTYKSLNIFPENNPHIKSVNENSNDYDIKTSYNLTRLDKLVSYENCVNSFEYVTDKKYIMVIYPKENDDLKDVEFDINDWMEADGLSYDGCLEYEGIPINYIHFDVIKTP